mmetsp:Transcript_5522/g.6080  ORF Transcript_5522/g.6080 Transcript_5522/m.6080 type:complete len:522 (+) Transcript_5522:1-1566(+)
MTSRQFWRFLRDCQIPGPHTSLASVNRMFLRGRRNKFSIDNVVTERKVIREALKSNTERSKNSTRMGFNANVASGSRLGTRGGDFGTPSKTPQLLELNVRNDTDEDPKDSTTRDGKTRSNRGKSRDGPKKEIRESRDKSKDTKESEREKTQEKEGTIEDDDLHNIVNEMNQSLAPTRRINYDDVGSSDEEFDEDEDHPDDELDDVHKADRPILMRQFVEAVVRVAALKYETDRECPTLAARLKKLLSINLLPNADKNRAKTHEEEVSFEAAQAALEEYSPDLLELFSNFSKNDRSHINGHHDTTIEIREFLTVLRETDIIHSEFTMNDAVMEIERFYDPSGSLRKILENEEFGPKKKARLTVDHIQKISTGEMIFFEFMECICYMAFDYYKSIGGNLSSIVRSSIARSSSKLNSSVYDERLRQFLEEKLFSNPEKTHIRPQLSSLQKREWPQTEKEALVQKRRAEKLEQERIEREKQAERERQLQELEWMAAEDVRIETEKGSEDGDEDDDSEYTDESDEE